MRTAIYATLALIAFAANSLLCRLALRQAAIDPATFTTIRLIAGAVTLMLVVRAQGGDAKGHGSWTSAAVLALYAVPFSFAYTRLSAGTGALILFGAVQVTMLIGALLSGERPHRGEWLGLAAALAGLVYLLLPGITAPPLSAAALMGLAGCSWAIYTLRGRGTVSALENNTTNFIRALPFVVVVSIASLPQFRVDVRGLLFAVTSGALTSGLGYTIWYAALRGLTALRAAVLQVAVPVLAAIGGVLFLMETISARLVVAAILVLGGIAIAIASREMASKNPAETART
jgi:drug/metabolite transporter (DMT)-like permease